MPLSFALAACQGESQPSNEEAPALRPAPATVTAQARLHPVHPQFQLREPGASAAERAEANATGIVYSLVADTLPAELTVLNDTSGEVNTIARVRYYELREGSWADTIWASQPGLFGNLVRASHDYYGLQTVGVENDWARAIYAYNAEGEPQLGWVRLVPRRVEHVSYDSLLFRHPTQLMDAEAATFFTTPDGKRVQVELAPSHSLKVLRVEGDWIQVVVTRPDTTECGGNPAARVTGRDTAWLRRINKQGNRQIFAAVAGC